MTNSFHKVIKVRALLPTLYLGVTLVEMTACSKCVMDKIIVQKRQLMGLDLGLELVQTILL